MKNILYLFSFILFLSSCQTPIEVDMMVQDAKIYTINENFEMAEAMAIKDGKIIAIGSNEEIQSHYWAEESLNLNNQYVYPGFIDAHSHFISYGQSLVSRANLVGTKSFEEAIENLQVFEKEFPAEWLIGRGWDQNDWEVQEFPSKEKLDELWPNKAVYLTRIDGHAAIANSKALELAGINNETQIHGGEFIIKDGELTGVLIDNAMEMVREVMPSTSKELRIRAIKESEKGCFAVGLTTVCDAGLEYYDINLLQELHNSGQLKMRVYAMLTPTTETLEEIMTKGQIITDRLTVRSVKLYADGALGSRGACLLHDYHDKAHWKGMMLSPQAYFDSLCMMADKYNYQVNTHAIGDSANRVILKTYAKYLEDSNDKRWRIEHAQVVHPDDFHRFGDKSIIPSVQPTHATSDMYWADERLGPERIKSAYAFEELRQQNNWIPLGTDFPIEKIDPLLTFYAAVARMDNKYYPEDGFQMENALSRKDALKGITIWAAKAGFDEHKKGSLETGKFADFIVLKEDLLEVPATEIPYIKVKMTVVGGEMVYSSITE
ncbi:MULTISPECIES: amidohydrolase [unclassified Lentimicrobium]|uniref:amidohydrolase n=1 Tax=unclassified Lentimicrobium TaxID=2677434 RepID=UPI0015559B0E|nr:MULTISPECIES: amidohydrolase [unclassified Lentimicrobium]NPD45023.1 amidohydrolase [Lentimicrobium sp. S6]NPD86045.1 amidohydrolase [Lentimicrobium sp. L6]